MQKKAFWIICAAVAAIAAAAFGYFRYASVTKVGTLNFPDFTVERFIRSNNNPFVRIRPIPMDAPEKMSGCDVVIVRVHGSSLTAAHMQAIKDAIASGVTVYSTESGNSEINSLDGESLKYVDSLLTNESAANFRSLFNYLRKEVDGKLLFNKEYHSAAVVPSEYYFHLGEDNFFADYQGYDRFYRESGKHKEGAANVALLSGNINLQNSNEEHIAALINSLEAKGMNVYPINAFGPGKLKMISDVRPDIIINRPHGRLVMGAGEHGTEFLKSLGVPVLSPLTVSEKYEDWIASAQGMTSGGMTSMSIVLPELDGAIAPYAVAAQFDRNGMLLFDSIPGHTEKFCRLVKNYAELRRKDNKDKRVAIYYYKGTGKGAVSASDIEGVESLFNTLKLLKEHGYNVSGIPSDAKSLERLIHKSGAVLGPYALGAYDEFIRSGNPEFVSESLFTAWAKSEFPQELLQQMESRNGKFPGKYMTFENAQGQNVAVARIRFGNVAILPQPLPSTGEDISKIVHGSEGAPAYPYVASYLWTRKGFKADAIIHFGTHGSLEFIPGKQVALSDMDWSDALIGDIPHFYIYTTGNIGEGVIAKRRSYAALISHLTSPFMQSGLYDGLSTLKREIHKMEILEDGEIKRNYAESITNLAKAENILSALSLDSTRTLSYEQIEKIHAYLEEIDGAKVIDGLYTLGEGYTAEQAYNTARLMSVDPIRYSLAAIDLAKGIITEEQMDNISFISHRYDSKTESIISAAFAGKPSEWIFNQATLPKDRQIFREIMDRQIKQRKEMISSMTESQSRGMMEKMAAAIAESDEKTHQDTLAGLTDGLKTLKEAIANAVSNRDNLLKSTELEQKSLIDALDGKYIAPAPGGDPIVNPSAVPTGRNFYSINPEATPSPQAWKTGKRLAEDILANELEAKGEYPEKIAFTLWATDFISSEGATVAQILYLLGVEPLRDGFGYVRSLKLIPREKLGRPRIDVVVQTSGQLRDIAASRLALINKAVKMAAGDDSPDNFVRKGLTDAESLLLAKGFSPEDARKYSSERIFGGVSGNYGTGIMGLVEKGDNWESEDEIASQYIRNMGALYGNDGSEEWGQSPEGVFEAALLNTSAIVQPRSSNTWGPLSLDHVYEFMGGISSAVRKVTGNDPSGYFNDFRNSNRSRVQELKQAIGVESSSTLFNPKYISGMLEGEASAMEHFAETFRNTYGWNVMKPSAIDQSIWNGYYDIYIKDKYNLDIRKAFTQKNPFALEEMTAVMLESARKGMWKASQEQIRTVAEMHAELVSEHTAGCSGFICDNAKLRKFIAENIPQETARSYDKGILQARQAAIEDSDRNMLLKKQEQHRSNNAQNIPKDNGTTTTLWIILATLAALAVWLIAKRRKRV